MGRYDFTSLPNRLGNHAVKWQEVEKEVDLLPLWVADMDFLPAPEIQVALKEYAEKGDYGYPYISDEVYDAVLDWERVEHNYEVERSTLVFIEGVVPAISTAIQALTQEGDAVLINTPVYPPFARSVRLNNRRLVDHPLVEKDGRYTLDFERLEADIISQEVKLYILCSPHNPGGRVWTRGELEQIGRLCQKHGLILVSDEIHQDLTLFGHRHHSFNTVSPDFKEFSLILASATKTFNIAGTKNSFAIIENPKLRQKFQHRQLANNQHEIPTVGLISTEAAFGHGKEWLTQLKQVLEENITLIEDILTQQTKIRVMKPEGTYLVWLDFSAYQLDHQELVALVRDRARLILNDGQTFGRQGRQHLRLNAAAPQEVVREACRRLVAAFA